MPLKDFSAQRGKPEKRPKDEVTEQDLIDFALDQVTEEQRQRVAAALGNPNSYASRWMRKARDIFSVCPLHVDLGFDLQRVDEPGSAETDEAGLEGEVEIKR